MPFKNHINHVIFYGSIHFVKVDVLVQFQVCMQGEGGGMDTYMIYINAQ